MDLQRDAGFVQAGWTHKIGGPVNAYCEHLNRYDLSEHELQEFPMSLASHLYEWSYDAADTEWHCRWDGALLEWVDYTATDFGTGGVVDAQGEAWARHGQVGKMAPGAMLLSGLRWRRASNNVWSDMNLVRNTPDDPYGSAVPEPGKLQVWTNAH